MHKFFVLQVGGFALPFVTLGCFLVLTVPANFMLLPPDPIRLGDAVTKETVSMRSLLRIPSVLVVCAAIFLGSVGWSVLDPTLAPHMEQVQKQCCEILAVLI